MFHVVVGILVGIGQIEMTQSDMEISCIYIYICCADLIGIADEISFPQLH